jgi:hypothetical protein
VSATTTRDIALDSTGDIDISGQDLKQTQGIQAVLQGVSIRLKFFYGEWFADTTIGVPYFQKIMVKNPDVNILTAIFRSAILGTPGVNSLSYLKLDFNPQARTLAVSFAGDTDFGQFDTQTVELTQ